MKSRIHKPERIPDERLDSLLFEVGRALEASDAEVEAIVSSPFLPRRLQVNIAAEKRRRAESESGWMAMFAAARRAVPALALTAVLALGWLWMATPRTPARQAHNPSSETGFAFGGVSTMSNEEIIIALMQGGDGSAPASAREQKQ